MNEQDEQRAQKILVKWGVDASDLDYEQYVDLIESIAAAFAAVRGVFLNIGDGIGEWSSTPIPEPRSTP